MEKRVAIIGAGISGLLACKYAASRGFNPVVFEAEEQVGGLWNHTIESTRLQNIKDFFQFSDFPWPSSVRDPLPTNAELLEYLQSYARHFELLPYIKFNSKVISVSYVGECEEEMQSWNCGVGVEMLLGPKGNGTSKFFTPKKSLISRLWWQEYAAEFVVICIGRFSGLPEIPSFPPGYGPEVFSGKVLHSMDYSAMDNANAAEFIKGKRIAIIGNDIPCTVIQRTIHWMFPHDAQPWGLSLGFLCFSRFAELLVHKPGEAFLSSILATSLSPLVLFLPPNFYDKVEDRSIVLKKSQCFSFCEEGLILEGEDDPVEADIVIYATGYKGDEKLKNIFSSPTFQNCIAGSPTSAIPLYSRQMIHPRIPQLVVISYSESFSNLYTFEMRCKWLGYFLDEAFKLPSIKEMEEDIKMWEKYMKMYSGNGKLRRACISGVPIWYNDQLCKDIGCNPRRKKGFFTDLFEPYGLADYKEL
ncbi:UNVERIFIED_CONTAM: putative flavin-containing monooxygenase 1 [Sesamum latifolium]|uniref:Flavin-containing monooxygenase n=1 Tax=Sesamum latifolium TaxID=2727402 RepID=A0AAW2VGG0_9LAMI